MNILEALKKYIRANGGSSRANNISEAVKDLDSIPQSSGGGGMVVNVVVSDTEPITFTVDKTISEILTAYHSGVVVRAHMYRLSGSFDMWLELGMDSEAFGGLVFGNIMFRLDDEGYLTPMYILVATKDEDTGDDVWRSDVLI